MKSWSAGCRRRSFLGEGATSLWEDAHYFKGLYHLEAQSYVYRHEIRKRAAEYNLWFTGTTASKI